MARTKGSNNFSGTLEALAGGPLDARAVVPTKADLTTASNFPYPYVGMIVSVTAEGKAYLLTATPVTTEANWKEIGSGGNIAATSVTYSNTSSGMSATNAQSAIDELKTDIDNLPAVFTPAGSVAFASLPSLTAGNVGKVVNVTDAFTTTSNFVEGSGKSYPAGTNVAIVDVGSGSSHSYKYDAMSGFVDLSGKADKVSGATSGHLAALNSSGNLTDSGKALSDLQAKLTAGNGITINSSTNTISADVNYLIGAYDIYDGTERVVGYYYGKPLYRKCFEFGALSDVLSQTELTWQSIGSNVDKFVKIEGVLKSNTGWFSAIPSGASTNTSFVEISAWNNASGNTHKNQISILYNGNQAWITSCYVVIEYTKTTDSTSSVSYGHENQYSTSEQIVGTWIDGKPLYQKTINFGTLPNATSKTVNHNISNLGLIVKADGITNDGTATATIPYSDPASLNNNICLFVDNTKITIRTGANRSAYTTTYITLQYTKTTD